MKTKNNPKIGQTNCRCELASFHREIESERMKSIIRNPYCGLNTGCTKRMSIHYGIHYVHVLHIYIYLLSSACLSMKLWTWTVVIWYESFPLWFPFKSQLRLFEPLLSSPKSNAILYEQNNNISVNACVRAFVSYFIYSHIWCVCVFALLETFFVTEFITFWENEEREREGDKKITVSIVNDGETKKGRNQKRETPTWYI